MTHQVGRGGGSEEAEDGCFCEDDDVLVSNEDAVAIQCALRQDEQMEERQQRLQAEQEKKSFELAWKIQQAEQEKSRQGLDRRRHVSAPNPHQPSITTASREGTVQHVGETVRKKQQQRSLIVLLCCCFLALSGILLFVGYQWGKVSATASASQNYNDIPLPRVNALLDLCQETMPAPRRSNVSVAAYYYPWYGENQFHGGQYIRKYLVPPQFPALGEYDDSQPAVIAVQLCWSRYANVDAWLTSWWGPNDYSDTTTRNVILPHAELGNLQIAVHYESMGRANDENRAKNLTLLLERAGPDVTYLCEHYFASPNYMRIEGRPVLVVYLSRSFEKAGLMREIASLMRQAAIQCGETGLYIVGDHAFGTDVLPLDYLDAITNYDVYGSMPMASDENYAYQSGVDQYRDDQQQWRDLARQQQVHYIPAATPGFNNRANSTEHAALSRQLNPDLPFGSLWKASLQQALDLVEDAPHNWVFVTSWNEWHEDTVRS